MSVLDRRVQILVDPDQYAELEREASQTGRSVAAVIRDSISDHLAVRQSNRAAAANRLLQSIDIAEQQEDWADDKALLAQELIGKLP